MNKKGSIQDFLYIMVAIFILSVVTLLVFKISNSINTEIQANSDMSAESKDLSAQVNSMYPGVIDNSFLLLTVGLSVVAIALAFMVRIHPVFLVFYILVLVLLIIFAGIFSNVYTGIAENPDFTAEADSLVFISTIMRILPMFVAVLGTVLAIVMYKVWQSS
jgi:hypothetical protein